MRILSKWNLQGGVFLLFLLGRRVEEEKQLMVITRNLQIYVGLGGRGMPRITYIRMHPHTA